MSQNDIMVFVHGFEEAMEAMKRYLPSGFKLFQMDLNVLMKTLAEKIRVRNCKNTQLKADAMELNFGISKIQLIHLNKTS